MILSFLYLISHLDILLISSFFFLSFFFSTGEQVTGDRGLAWASMGGVGKSGNTG